VACKTLLQISSEVHFWGFNPAGSNSDKEGQLNKNWSVNS